MKAIIILFWIACLNLAFPAYAVLEHEAGIISGMGGGTYTVTWNFEETGTPTGATVLSNTPNFDDTSPAISGTESASVDNSTGTESFKLSFTNYTEVWVSTKLQIVDATPAAVLELIRIRDSANNYLCYLQLRTDGTIRVYTTGVVLQTTLAATMSDATTHYFKIRLKYVDGANDEIEVWSDTDGIWGESDLNQVDAAYLGQADHLYFLGGSNKITVDDVKVSSANIGNY